jgi:hypothetical protein
VTHKREAVVVMSTGLAAEGEVIWSDARSVDVSHATCLVFGRLVRLAAPVIRRYESDLFHDALWLREHLAGTEFTFFWSVGESGTHIGTDEALAHQAARILHHTGMYRVTVALDRRNRTVLAVFPPSTPHTGVFSDG